MNEVIPQHNAKEILNEDSKTGQPINLKHLQEDAASKGAVRMIIKIRQFMIRRYTSLSTDLKNLIGHLDTELVARKE